jgi:hypothetical protein
MVWNQTQKDSSLFYPFCLSEDARRVLPSCIQPNRSALGPPLRLARKRFSWTGSWYALGGRPHGNCPPEGRRPQTIQLDRPPRRVGYGSSGDRPHGPMSPVAAWWLSTSCLSTATLHWETADRQSPTRRASRTCADRQPPIQLDRPPGRVGSGRPGATRLSPHHSPTSRMAS